MTENTKNTETVETPKLKTYTLDELPSTDSFEELELKENLLKGIYSMGFEKPSTVQRKMIKPMIQGREVVAQSQSGTGKTGTFVIGILQRIDENVSKPQALIMCNTHELAKQTQKVVNTLGQYMGIKTHLMIGGTRKSKYSFKKDDDFNNTHVIIGTLGRIWDNISNKKMDLSNMKLAIIDECDEMLSESFQQTIQGIIMHLRDVQICLFSATIQRELVDEILVKFMKDPLICLLDEKEVTLDGIKQYYVMIDHEEDKIEYLKALFKYVDTTQTFVFINNKRKVDQLYVALKEEKYPVAAIHSGIDHGSRKKIMDNFRAGDNRILLSTSMMARGIDVQSVKLVFNYDLPNENEDYIHQIGRSGRFGRKGVAINFVLSHDLSKIEEIKEQFKTNIEMLPSDVESVFDSI